MHIQAEDFLTSTRNRHAVEHVRTETVDTRVAQVGTDVRRAGHASDEVEGTMLQRAGTWVSNTVREARHRARGIPVRLGASPGGKWGQCEFPREIHTDPIFPLTVPLKSAPNVLSGRNLVPSRSASVNTAFCQFRVGEVDTAQQRTVEPAVRGPAR